jgi:KamA family protein
MFRLMFPQEGMLSEAQVAAVARARQEGGAPLRAVVRDIRESLNPHPAGQQTDNRAWLDGAPVDGLQHKYAETVLFFPSAGQTCHAYCSFCFRWAQFVGEPDWKIQAKEAAQAAAYLRAHPEITDILITGGDPAIMPTRVLARYIEPFLKVETLRTIRIGTKALSYWPGRFTTDDDADDLMRLFERVVASGRHLALMAHLNHWRELEPEPVQAAVARLRGTGAVIRTQAPILAHINDDAETWARLWERSVALGMVPYYMFVERDTGPAEYFRVPLLRAWDVCTEAQRRVSGLARSARGPVMSAHPGKIVLDGPVETGTGPALSLRFLQARDPALTGRPFLARHDAGAAWLDALRPLPGLSFPHETAHGP